MGKRKLEIKNETLMRILNEINISDGNKTLIINNGYFKFFYNTYLTQYNDINDDIINLYLQHIIVDNDISILHNNVIEPILQDILVDSFYIKLFDYLFIIENEKRLKLSNLLNKISETNKDKYKLVLLLSCLNTEVSAKQVCELDNCYTLMSSIKYNFNSIRGLPTENIILDDYDNANINLLTLLKYNFENKTIDTKELCYTYFNTLNTNNDKFINYFNKTPILVPSFLPNKYYFNNSDITDYYKQFDHGNILYGYDIEFYSKLIMFVFLFIISKKIEGNKLYTILGEFNINDGRTGVEKLYYEGYDPDDINVIFNNLLKYNNFECHSLIANIYHQFFTIIEQTIRKIKLYSNFYKTFKDAGLIIELYKEISTISISPTLVNVKTIERIIEINGIDRNNIKNKTIAEIIENRENNEDNKKFYRQLTTYFKFVYHNYDTFYYDCNSLTIYDDDYAILSYMNSYVHSEKLDNIYNHLLTIYIEPILKVI